MEPRIETRDEFMVVGLAYVGMNQNGEIPKLWNSFMPRMADVSNWVDPKVSYGVCFDMQEGGSFHYLACREVDNLDNAPAGMAGTTIPPAKYAVFTHTGPVDTLVNTYKLIYSEWLPKAGLQPLGSYDFERYDRRFNNSETSEMEIWIPIG